MNEIMWYFCRRTARKLLHKQIHGQIVQELIPKWSIFASQNFPSRSLRTVAGKVSGKESKESEYMKRRQVGKQGLKTARSRASNEISSAKEQASSRNSNKEQVKSERIHRVITTDELKEYPFLSLGVSKQLVKRLKENFGISDPLEIQSLAIRPISSRKNLVIHSETGSGKTLAYLLPVIQQAKHRCHTLIAVPTRELAYQIYIEARKLAPKKDVACYVSRPDIETEFLKLKESPPKVIIGTPKKLVSIVRDHEFLFSNVKRFVADEVDKMIPPIPVGSKRLLLKREKHPRPINILLAMVEGIAKSSVQYIACSATINENMITSLKDLQWGQRLRLIKSEKCNEGTVAIPSSITHNYLTIPDFSIDSKVAALSRVFLKTGKKPILVFVHRDHSSNDYVEELNNLNINAVSYYKQLLSGDLNDIKNFYQDFRTGKTSIVVASEEEVRGLDFKDLYHVFLFDIPRTAEEYLHLAGRVGRLGKEGMVTTVIPDLHDTGFQRLKDIYKRLGITGNEIII